MTNISLLTAFLSLIALFGSIVGSYVAYRVALSKTKDAISDRVFERLKIENEVLQEQVHRLQEQIDKLQGLLDKEVANNKLLHQQFVFVIDVMGKSYGLAITFINDVLRVRDKSGWEEYPMKNGGTP